TFSISSIVTGLFSQARINPLINLSRLNSCLVPSFFTIINGVSSFRSKVRKRNPHRSHSLRLLIASPSSKGLESRTRECLWLHFGHFIRFQPHSSFNPTS